MKYLFSLVLGLFITINSWSQQLEPLTQEYLAAQNTKYKVNLADRYSLFKHEGYYYGTHKAFLLYKNIQIFAGDMAYKSNTNLQPLRFVSQSDFIFFKNMDTDEVVKVIDLKPILKDAEIKQIGHAFDGSHKTKYQHEKHVYPSIAITEDGKYLFFGTATNTYKYDLTTDTWEEIIINNRHVELSPMNKIVSNTTLIFMIMQPIGTDGWTYDRSKFLKYDFVSKKDTIIVL